jgi:hypothetical protein
LGNAYVGGTTLSADFPTAAALQSLAGTQDAFVARLSYSGATLTLDYSTYFGGEQGEAVNGIAIDGSGNALVAGSTSSTTSFPLVNRLPPSAGVNDGTNGDAFVARLSFAGSTLALDYSTYLGGSNNDVATSLAADSSGSAHVAGFTESIDFPEVNQVTGSGDGGGGDRDSDGRFGTRRDGAVRHLERDGHRGPGLHEHHRHAELREWRDESHLLRSHPGRHRRRGERVRQP